MRIKSLNINNLRNIEQARIEPCSGLNCLVGDNGAGKTTVLESLVMLAKGRSFRTGRIESLIGPAADSITVTAVIEIEQQRETRLGMERTRDGWRARKDGEDVRQLGDLAGELPLVLLEPNSHQIVGGAPEGRRRFLDWTVFHVEHHFLSQWRKYARALKQRNAALRSGDVRTTQSLDPLLIDLGERIQLWREEQANCLIDGAEQRLQRLSPGLSRVKSRYYKGWKGDGLGQALASSFDRDFDRGMTGPGPHRADIHFTVDSRPARDSLSRGEQKLLASALLLAQGDVMAGSGKQPVFLLDDLASEFDSEHAAAVLDASLEHGAQVWLTGTSLDTHCANRAANGRVFHVEHGRIGLSETIADSAATGQLSR